jgi:mannosyltransferase OCH1-like enzyme
MQLSEYYRYLIKFGPLYTIREIFYRFCHNIAEKLIVAIPERFCISYLKKYLKKLQPSDVDYTKTIPHPCSNHTNCIWICWLQGYEKAPPIVKACIQSTYKYANGYDVMLITEENIDDYVIFPPYIIKKYKNGKIPVAQFSDMLRTLLLINYGGIWLDSTILLTKNIPKVILDADLFFFKSSVLENDFLPCSSWFISAKENNSVLKKALQIFFLYWKEHNNCLHYFIYHLIIRLLITYDEESKLLWQRIPYKNNSDPHVLQFCLFDVMDTEMQKYIWDMSFVHKLTYKFENTYLPEKENTYYKYILENQ